MAARIIGIRRRKRAAETPEPIGANVRLGTLVGIEGDTGVWVKLAASPTPVFATIAIAADAETLTRAIETAQQAVLTFADGDASHPILIGLVGAVESAVKREVERASQPPFVVEADADGRRVRVAAHEEIIFQCGEASVTLKRDGRVVIRGAYIETRASGTNRIKGGNVRIN